VRVRQSLEDLLLLCKALDHWKEGISLPTIVKMIQQIAAPAPKIIDGMEFKKEEAKRRLNPSKFLTVDEMVELKKFLGKNAHLELAYDGKENEFKARPFHQACDDKGTTITVGKTEGDYVFGMYTTVPWRSNGGQTRNTGTSWVCRLSTPQSKKVYQAKMKPDIYYGFYHDSDMLPVFASIVLKSRTDCNSNNGTKDYLETDHITEDYDQYNFWTGDRNFTLKELEIYFVTDKAPEIVVPA
jgi:hypothetical protein